MNDKLLFQWDDNLSLGVEAIDRDHKRLFSIIGKILLLSNQGEEERVKHAAKEGLKFLVTYSVEHFQREEAFMLSQNFEGYETHKAMHEDLKQNILPSLRLTLEESDYSVEEIRHFLGVCVGWLSTHIMMMDQAIIAPRSNQIFNINFTSPQEQITAIIQTIIKDLYKFPADLISGHYTGWDFGSALFYEITVKEDDNKVIHLLYVLEEKLVFTLASKRIGIEIKKVDTYLLGLLENILSNITSQMKHYLQITGKPKQRTGQMIESSEVRDIFKNKTLNYSSLFSTKCGKFAFCVYER